MQQHIINKSLTIKIDIIINSHLIIKNQEKQEKIRLTFS